MPGKAALITGATGLVGKELVRLILSEDYYNVIYVLSRRELAIKDNRLKIILLDDFGQMDFHKDAFNVNDVYCCLGTTMKNAGSKENFRKIDLDYPLQMAKLAKDQPNFENYLVVTAVGAHSDSPLFYNKIKGELEDQLEALDLKSLKIFRPSLLLGYRDDFRLGEEFAKLITTFLSFFMIRSKRKLWSINGRDVARAMFEVAKKNKPGTSVFLPKHMRKFHA